MSDLAPNKRKDVGDSRPRAAVFRGDNANVAASATLLKSAFDTKFEQAQKPTTAIERLASERESAMNRAYQEGLLAATMQVEDALADANAKVKRLVNALSVAVEDLEARQGASLRDVEDAIASAAVSIATAILEREVACSVDPGAEALARALKLTSDGDDIVARLNPQDVTTLSMDSIDAGTRKITIIGDDAIEPGGALLEIGEQRIDAQLSSAIERVRAVLNPTH